MIKTFSCKGIGLATVLATSLLFATSTPATATAYKFIDLAIYGFYARAINNSEQMAGQSGTHAALWDGNAIVDLGTLGGWYSEGLGINAAGQVVGYSITAEGHYHAFSTGPNGAGMTDLGRGRAIDINDAGQAVGNSVFSASVWNGSTVSTLSALDGQTALAINNASQIVGSSTIDDTAHTSVGRAILWNGTATIDLGTLGGRSATAYGINNSGQIVGASAVYNGYSHATLWDGNTITDLGIFSNGTQNEAGDINDAGQIVGYADVILPNGHRTGRAILWEAGTMIDLNDFLDASTINAGWVLSTAADINDNGAIIGQARNVFSGVEAYIFAISFPTVTPVNTSLGAANLHLNPVRCRYYGPYRPVP